MIEGIQWLYWGFKHDEVLKAMWEDEETHTFALQRMAEITENALAAEREIQIESLLKEIQILKLSNQ